MKNTFLLSMIFFLCLSLFSFTNNDIPNPEELGKVNWLRDYDEARQLSAQQAKPILILFQEVPGCSTCKGFGNNVLSHPLIVDAIENEFVPLAIYNNKTGKDLKVLKRFGEPAWNNPVVRIINNKQDELTGRLARYNALELVNGMVEALQKVNANIPNYLQFLQADLSKKNKPYEAATFGMYCFWIGESKIGSIKGVVASKPGFMNGGEVVEVQYDPEVISYKELVRQAKALDAFDRLLVKDERQRKDAQQFISKNKIQTVGKFRADNEPQYYLSKSLYRYLPLLPIQATKINAAIAAGASPFNYLSPGQIKLLEQIKAHPDKKRKTIYQSPYFKAAWENLEDSL